MMTVQVKDDIHYESIVHATNVVSKSMAPAPVILVNNANPTHGQLTISFDKSCAIILQFRVKLLGAEQFTLKRNFVRPKFVVNDGNPLKWNQDESTKAVLAQKGWQIIVKKFVNRGYEGRGNFEGHMRTFANAMLTSGTNKLDSTSVTAKKNADAFFNRVRDVNAISEKKKKQRALTPFDEEDIYEPLFFDNVASNDDREMTEADSGEENEESQESDGEYE